jgi:hypothetical protein
MEDNRLYWEGSKTLYEACKYLATKGFIAAELYESQTRLLCARNAELEKERDEWKKRCIEEGEETARLFLLTQTLEAKISALK